MVMRVSPRGTAEVLSQILRMANGAAFTEGLNPAQWSALRFFASAAPESCTVTAFARYHGSTTGTASQTVSALVRKGLLERISDPTDRRSNRLDLTAAGREALDSDPLDLVSRAVGVLDEESLRTLALALERVLRALLAETAGRRFSPEGG